MNASQNKISQTLSYERNTSKLIKLLVFVFEISLVIILLIVWFRCDSVRRSKSLWVLFFYSFPSQFLISIVPHEPVFIYFSKFYNAFIVTVIAIAGTLLTEIINYTAFKFVADLNKFEKIRQSTYIKKVTSIYKKAPFLSLLVAGFTPIPFYPFRFLVVLAQYPLIKYLSAVFLSRSIRFYILATIGHAIKITDRMLLILFVCLIIMLNGPIFKEIISTRKNKLKSEGV